MAFKILLTENQSPLGGALSAGFEHLSLPLLCPDFLSDQWGDAEFVRCYLQDTRPSVIVNTLRCELSTGPEGSQRDLVLLQVCKELDLTVIQLSSHLVFAREQRNGEVLSEQDEPNPSSAWGRHILEVESATAAIGRSIILRLPWVLDGADGIIFKAAELLLSETGIKASDLWRGTPVFLNDIVRAVVAMTQQILCGAENWGVFHFHSSDSCSEAEFADYIARILNRKRCSIGPVSVANYEANLFPGNGWLVGNRCTNCFGIQFRSWRQGTKTHLEFWLEQKCAQGAVQIRTGELPENTSREPKAI